MRISGLTRSANNFFGIKAGKSWNGERATYGTGEQDSAGRGYREQAAFRKYATPEDSFKDHLSLLDRRFPEATRAGTFSEAVAGLRFGQQGGYATDKDYGRKLESIGSKLRPPSDPMGGVAQPQQRDNGTPANQPNLPPEVQMQVAQQQRNETSDLVDRHYGQGTPPSSYEYRQPYQPPQQQQAPEQFLQLTGLGPQGAPSNAFAGGGGDDIASFFGLGGGGGGGDFGFGFG